ncbi:MAG TPA: dihydroneopterin aldolase [Sphingomonadaceae bacterium]|nr:dihydroneopterin aldolase [Sphingomonadaceae bacterium]
MADPAAGEPGPAPAILTSTISVRDLTVAADIGVYAHEVGQPQTLLISVTLHVRPTTSDSLADATDYTRIATAAEALAAERIALIESFAYRLALTCLGFTGVEQADVLVEKPGAIANGMAGTRIVLRHPVP